MCRNLLPNFVENAQCHDRHFYNLVFAKILKIGKLNLLKEYYCKKNSKKSENVPKNPCYFVFFAF